MDSHKQGKFHMVPKSNTWNLMDATPQTRPRYHGHTTVAQLIPHFFDDLGGKYLGKEHSLHLKPALEYKYKVTTGWETKLYIDISLKCDY